MTALDDAAIELVRAALDPASAQARVRKDSPVCQVVVRAAQADLATAGAENINNLAAGVSVAAGLLTQVLAQQRGQRPGRFLAGLDADMTATGMGLSTPVLDLLKTMLTGPRGMGQAARFLARLFGEDEEGFYDLIVDLGGYVAACVQMLEALNISSREETLADLEDALKA